MNATHARPMLAFWLLAAVAAMITGLGLHDGGAAVTVRAGSPSPVSRGGTPELVLGGVLHGTPVLTADPIAGSPTGALPDVSAVYVARPAVVIRADSAPRPAVAPKPRTVVKHSTPRTRATTTVPTRSTTTSTPTTQAPTRPGRGHHAGSGRGPTKTSAAAATTVQVTSQPSPHGHGPTGRGKSGH